MKLSAVVCSGLLLGLFGCDGDDINPPPTGICPTALVTITTPLDGDVVDGGDDVNATEEGVQLDIQVRTSRIAEGTSISLSIVDQTDAETTAGPVDVDADGNASFAGVTLPSGLVTLTVTTTGCDGMSEDAVLTDTAEVNVIGDVPCTLAIREPTVEADFYAPLPVLNRTSDTDASTAGFQGNIDVVSGSNYNIELFVLDLSTGTETSEGTANTDETGSASFATTLDEGTKSLRVTCTSRSGGQNTASLATTVVVDVTAPSCSLDGREGPVIPTDDEDPETDGVQVTLNGSVTGDDVQGEPASFEVSTNVIDGSPVAADGATSAIATFNSPGAFAVVLRGRDRAGNTCASDEETFDVVLEGCSIAFVSPTEPVVADSDPAVAGLQSDVVIEVGAECAGREVRTNCTADGTELAADTAGNGQVTFRSTLCRTNPCELDGGLDCSAEVTSPDSITTSVDTNIVVDNRPPSLALLLTRPSIACGGQVTEAVDINAETDGVQVEITAIAVSAAERRITLTNADGTTELTLGQFGAAIGTLSSGLNTFDATVTDGVGNATSASCEVTLAEIALTFREPVADGATLGADAGTVGPGGLEFPICLVSSDAGATIEISVDGGAALPTTLSMGVFCTAPVTLAEGPHSIIASGTSGAQVGSASADVEVDLTPPPPPTGLVAEIRNRASVTTTWTAPTETVGYIGKFDTSPLNDGNFDTNGTEFATPFPASAPGATEQTAVSGLVTGTPLFFAVVAVDAVGNRSAPATAGPVTPEFIRSGVRTPIGAPPGIPADSEQRFGYNSVAGDYNADGFSDLAVAAPRAGGQGLVYVYFGSPNGLAETPAIRIRPTAAGSLAFGFGLASVDWNRDGIRDIAIGAPGQDGGNGSVTILFGGDTFEPVPDTVTDVFQSKALDNNCGDSGAQRCGASITTDGAGVLGGAFLGWSLSAIRFNDGNQADLAIGLPGLADDAADPDVSFVGGAIVLIGGNTAQQITISAETVTGASGAFLFKLPGEPSLAQYGSYVHNVGAIASSQRQDLLVSPDENSTVADTVYVFRGRNHPGGGAVVTPAFGGSDLSVTTEPNIGIGLHAGSIPDVGGTGTRDIVMSASRRTPGTVYIVNGNATGAQVLNAVVETTITGNEFGTGIANNVDDPAASADINGDDLGDLVTAASASSDPQLFVWFGGSIPGGGVTTTTASADLVLNAPTAFTRLRAIDWTGDTNDDGFSGICWADDEASQGARGEIELLR